VLICFASYFDKLDLENFYDFWIIAKVIFQLIRSFLGIPGELSSRIIFLKADNNNRLTLKSSRVFFSIIKHEICSNDLRVIKALFGFNLMTRKRQK
jgi:hypothetical protein